jgi:hypothetical protein
MVGGLLLNNIEKALRPEIPALGDGSLPCHPFFMVISVFLPRSAGCNWKECSEQVHG